MKSKNSKLKSDEWTDMEITPNDIAGMLLIKIKRCEVNVHMRTLKGGYCDVIVIGKEVYELLIPEIKERLQEHYGHKMILKPKMYKPFIRYIWFGDNEHFIERDEKTTIETDIDKPIEDQERTIELQEEYLIKDGMTQLQQIIQKNKTR